MAFLIYFVTASAIVLLAVSAFHKKATEAQNRSKECLCIWCGYDLRASPNVCPECGKKAFRRLDQFKMRRTPALHEQWPADLARFDTITDEDLICIVHETTEREEARLLVLQLEARHIAARKSDTELPGQSFLVLHQVWACEEQMNLAREVAQSFEVDQQNALDRA